jgi:phosphate/phosphite/phosphonate ABC transporter binding protein
VHFVRDGDVQIAWAPPLLAIDLERETQAKIRLCSRRAGRLDYMSVLFVPAASSIEKFEELEGKRVAWVAKESSAGYVVPRLQIASQGLDPENLFAEETFRRTHEAVVRAVMAGESDVGATFASFPERQHEPNNPGIGQGAGPLSTAGWLEVGVKNEEVRIVSIAGPIPSDVIAMSTALPEDTASAIADGLRHLGQSVRLLLNADGFEQPDESHFDGLRKLVEAVKPRATT